jgi:hypothetical protein
MLTPELISEAMRHGYSWGMCEADLDLEQGRWREWVNGNYCGWLPKDDAERTAYEDLLDRCAKTAYEMMRDAFKANQEAKCATL